MKKTMLLSLVLVLVVFLKMTGQELKTVTSEGSLYTLEVPSSWIPDAAARGMFNFLFLTDPAGKGERLSISATKSPLNLERSYKINRDALKDYRKFTILEEGSTSIGGQECRWLICTFSTKEGLSMKGKQYTIAYNNKNYCLSYYVLDNEYDRVAGPFDKVLETLKFIQ